MRRWCHKDNRDREERAEEGSWAFTECRQEARGEKEVGSGNHGEPSKFAINADNEAVEPSLAGPGVKGKGIVEQY